MNDIVISEIQILPVKPQNGLVGFASFILFNAFFVGDVAIYSRPDGSGYRLVYPIKTLQNGKIISCIHPIRREVGEAVTNAVARAMDALSSRCDKMVKNECYTER